VYYGVVSIKMPDVAMGNIGEAAVVIGTSLRRSARKGNASLYRAAREIKLVAEHSPYQGAKTPKERVQC